MGKLRSASLKDSRHRAFLPIARKALAFRRGLFGLRREFFRRNSLTPAPFSSPLLHRAAPGNSAEQCRSLKLASPAFRNVRSVHAKGGVARHGSLPPAFPQNRVSLPLVSGSKGASLARVSGRQALLSPARLAPRFALVFAPVASSLGPLGRPVCASAGSCSARSASLGIAPGGNSVAPGSLGLLTQLLVPSLGSGGVRGVALALLSPVRSRPRLFALSAFRGAWMASLSKALTPFWFGAHQDHSRPGFLDAFASVLGSLRCINLARSLSLQTTQEAACANTPPPLKHVPRSAQTP